MSDCQHSPAFEKLCDLAEQARLEVRLTASAETMQFAHRRGEEFRQLTRIELWRGPRFLSPKAFDVPLGAGKPLAAAPIVGDDLEAAALDLLARVA